MTICRLCGDTLTYRYVNGRNTPVPIHDSGRCRGPLPVNDYSGSRQIKENVCYEMKCSECGEYVFFIRHNGGSCLIDPPLGPPWYKHSCFDGSYQNISRRTSICDEYNIKLDDISQSQLLCVVISVDVSWSRKVTSLIIATGDDNKNELLVTGSGGGYLLGKLCIYDHKKTCIYPIDTTNHTYNVIAKLGVSECSEQEFACPQCKVMVRYRDLKQHIEKHYLDSVISSCLDQWNFE